MKVKIGNKIFNPEEEPIMIILNDKDKENIKNMKVTATKYICFPKSTSIEEINKFKEEKY